MVTKKVKGTSNEVLKNVEKKKQRIKQATTYNLLVAFSRFLEINLLFIQGVVDYKFRDFGFSNPRESSSR